MENVVNFISSNGELVVAILMAVSALIGAVISKNKQQVYTRVYGLVIKAELLEGATGVDKFSYVFDNAYKALPFFIKMFVSEDNVKRAIEFTLGKLKDFAAEQMVVVSAVKVVETPIIVAPEVSDASTDEPKVETEAIVLPGNIEAENVNKSVVEIPVAEVVADNAVVEPEVAPIVAKAIPIVTDSVTTSVKAVVPSIELGIIPPVEVAPVITPEADAISKIQTIISTLQTPTV